MVRRSGGCKLFDKFAHHVVVLRLGIELPAAGHFAHFDPALVGLVGSDQQIEGRARHRLLHSERVGDLVERGGFVRGVDDGIREAALRLGFLRA